MTGVQTCALPISDFDQLQAECVELGEQPVQGCLVGEHTRQHGVAASRPGPQVRECGPARVAQAAADTYLVPLLATPPQPVAARAGHVLTAYEAADRRRLC